MLLDIPLKDKITDAELMKHNKEDSMWVSIHGKVFDLTSFYMEHPGGYDIIEEWGGKDATKQFEEGEHTIESIRDLKTFYIGEFEGKKITLTEMKQKNAEE